MGSNEKSAFLIEEYKQLHESLHHRENFKEDSYGAAGTG